MFGPLVESTPVRLLADERDRERAKLLGDPLEPRAGAREVLLAQIPRPRSRAPGRVRQPVAVAEELMLLRRRELSRREAGVVQQAPEVVARVGEMRGGG